MYFITYKYVYFNTIKESSHIFTILKVPAEIFPLVYSVLHPSQTTACLTSYLFSSMNVCLCLALLQIMLCV